MNELTLEQQFELQNMKEATKNMSREQALELLTQATRLIMIKTNVIQSLIQHNPLTPVE
jgi:hypothetical protein